MTNAIEFNRHYLGCALPIVGLLLPSNGPDKEQFLRNFQYDLRHWEDFFHFRKERAFFSYTEPLISILGSICGLRPGERIRVKESEELRFHYLFSCTDPPGFSPAKSEDSNREAWDDFLRNTLGGLNRTPSCDDLEKDEEELDGLLDALDTLADKAKERLGDKTRDEFLDWYDWIRNPGDRTEVHLPELPPDFWSIKDDIIDRNRFIEQLPWLRRRKQDISDRLARTIEDKGDIRCRTVIIEQVLGTYSFLPRLITLYPRMMRLILPSLFDGLPFLCSTEKHKGSIRCLVLLPDGRLASGSYDSTIRIWDLDNGKSIELKGHMKGVNCLVLLSDGRLASGSYDNTIRIWDLDNGKSIELKGHLDYVNCIVQLPDRHLASGSSDGTIRIWNMDTGKSIKSIELNGNGKNVEWIARLSGGRLASGCFDDTIRVWDIDTGVSIVCDRVYFCDSKSDGQSTSESWCSGLKLRTLGLDIGKSVELKGCVKGANCIVQLPDGRLASGSSDGNIRIWNVTIERSLEKDDTGTFFDGANFFCLLQDGRLASGSYDNAIPTLRSWDMDTGKSFELKGHEKGINCLSHLPDGRLASGSSDNTIRIWDLQTGQVTGILGAGVFEALKSVVEIHEATHALWHVGLDAGGRSWSDPSASSGVLHEMIAQYYTKQLCQWLADNNDDDSCRLLMAMFENLCRTLPVDSEYRLHERLDGIDGEAVRSFFLSFRNRGPQLTWDRLWNAILEAIITLFPFLNKYLSPVEMVAVKDWARQMTSPAFNMEQGCAILDGIGRLPALRQAIETAIHGHFPNREEAVLLCFTKVCRLTRASGPTLPFTLDAARDALKLEKPRIEPALLNHPVVSSLWNERPAQERKGVNPTLADVWPAKSDHNSHKHGIRR